MCINAIVEFKGQVEYKGNPNCEVIVVDQLDGISNFGIYSEEGSKLFSFEIPDFRLLDPFTLKPRKLPFS